ncbi:MAG: L,D-transpeptidase [Stappiaceae bacterium]
MRNVFFAALTALAGLSLPTAPAQSTGIAPAPPLYLSPNLADPWIMQLQPGRQGAKLAISRPSRLGKPSRRQRKASLNKKRQSPQQQRQTPALFLPTVVPFYGSEKPGTIIIDTASRHLYLVQSGATARRYGVGVGRPGFQWAGHHKVTRKAEWPSWRPPAEMLQRQPELPRFMEGGPNNPLGARALYLGSTLYRIHGSNEPWTIGRAVSSGCIRMRNEDVTDLYARVNVGTSVIVK